MLTSSVQTFNENVSERKVISNMQRAHYFMEHRIRKNVETSTIHNMVKNMNLNVIGGNLQRDGQTVVVKTLIKCNQSAMNARLNKIVSKLFETN